MTDYRSVPEVVPSTVEPGPGEVANVSGNHFDKHGSTSGLVRLLMDRFHSAVVDASNAFSPQSVLDAGCGEGRTTEIIRERVGPVVGVELERDALARARPGVPGLDFVAGSVYQLPFEDDSFDLVVCTEVLEHLTDPARALAEIVRVGRRGVVLTVPREPWWRAGNMARGAYVRQLGNTPGHLQHFTKRKLESLINRQVGIIDFSVRASTMWRVARISL